jgi:hypothetical protein
MGERNENLVLQIIFFILATDFLHAVKSYDMGPPALLLPRRKVFCGFLSPLKSIASAQFEPTNLGSSGKHINLLKPTIVFIILKK